MKHDELQDMYVFAKISKPRYGLNRLMAVGILYISIPFLEIYIYNTHAKVNISTLDLGVISNLFNIFYINLGCIER